MTGLQHVQVVLYVSSMAESVTFYVEKLGLPLTFPTWPTDLSAEHWVTVDAAGTSIALHAGGPGNIPDLAPAVSFSVKDIQQTRAGLTAKGIPFSEIEEPHPGVKLCHTKDPDGHTVFLHS